MTVNALRLLPVTWREACAFVASTHRHHAPPVGYKFAVGVIGSDDALVGVAMAGRPVARAYDARRTVEITRVATDGTPNACSMLYGACWRAARALGYTHAVTYTQEGESGASLRAAGWVMTAVLSPRRGWDAPSRRRPGNGNDSIARMRWEIGEGV